VAKLEAEAAIAKAEAAQAEAALAAAQAEAASAELKEAEKSAEEKETAGQPLSSESVDLLFKVCVPAEKEELTPQRIEVLEKFIGDFVGGTCSVNGTPEKSLLGPKNQWVPVRVCKSLLKPKKEVLEYV